MISKGIVVVPTHGFANRLRFLAAALHVFRGQAPAFYIDWRSDPHFSCDGPSSLFARPPKGYRAWVTKADYEQRKCLCYGGMVHMVQVLQKLQQIKEKKYEYLVLIGGHQPLYPSAPLLLPWLRHKHNFYSKGIRWSARVLGVAQAILDTVDRAPSDIVAVHARIISKQFDAADVQANPESMDFNANSPPERFRDLILGLQAGTPVLLFSNDESVARWLERACRAKGSKAVLHHASSSGGDRLSDAGVVRAVGEFVAMSRCGMILGTGMSSFSDEASFVHSIPKVLVLRKGIEDKMLTRYHANNLSKTPLGLLCLNAGPTVIKFFEKLL